MKDDREKWITPQLIVLGRGTPEENVLAGCKTSKLAGASATKVSCRKTFFVFTCSWTQCSTISKSS